MLFDAESYFILYNANIKRKQTMFHCNMYLLPTEMITLRANYPAHAADIPHQTSISI